MVPWEEKFFLSWWYAGCVSLTIKGSTPNQTVLCLPCRPAGPWLGRTVFAAVGLSIGWRWSTRQLACNPLCLSVILFVPSCAARAWPGRRHVVHLLPLFFITCHGCSRPSFVSSVNYSCPLTSKLRVGGFLDPLIIWQKSLFMPLSRVKFHRSKRLLSLAHGKQHLCWMLKSIEFLWEYLNS